MSTIKSVGSLSSVLKKPKISRKRLSRYSWLPDVLRVEGSVTTKIWGPVLTVTLFASAIAYAWHRGHNVTMSNSVTPLLAVVVGLILVFRNSTSYDRYYEGRKDFGAMNSNIRNLTRMIWVNVTVPPESSTAVWKGKGPAPGAGMTPERLRKLKIDAIKLCVAFAYGVKHRLRNEHGFNYEDYNGVLPQRFTRYDEFGYGTSSSPSAYSSYQGTPAETISRRRSDINGNHNANMVERGEVGHGLHIQTDSVTLSNDPQAPLLGDSHRTVEFHSNFGHSLPIPLLIAHELSRLVFRFKRDGFLETIGPAGTNTMNSLVQGMITQLTNMERVANTPIPVSYGIHLKQCVSLYLFSLPFTLVRDLEWRMIPVVTVVAFTLMGIEGIADEIEMPFGSDKSDLPLDKYCDEIRDEVMFMIERLPEGGEGMHGFDDGEGDD